MLTKLFNLTVNSVLSKMDWYRHGLLINGESISWIAYADDIALHSSTDQGISSITEDLIRESATVGLELNFDKTVFMSNLNAPPAIHVGIHPIASVAQLPRSEDQPPSELRYDDVPKYLVRMECIQHLQEDLRQPNNIVVVQLVTCQNPPK